MALCRIKTVEQLRKHSPGELGKLMGLDGIPEVRCLKKQDGYSEPGQGCGDMGGTLEQVLDGARCQCCRYALY